MDRRPPLVCILADAFRHDYLSERTTPYLHALAQNGWSAPLRSILGYSDGIRATAFTGRYPDQHGYWMEYGMRPDSSPWRWAQPLGALDSFPSDTVLRGTKLAVSMSAMRALARRRQLEHMDLRQRPVPRAAVFRSHAARPHDVVSGAGDPTIFDRCRDAGLKFVYLDSSKIDRETLVHRAPTLPEDIGLVFVYLHHIDMASHVFGLDSHRFRESVRDTDDLIRQTVAPCVSNFPTRRRSSSPTTGCRVSRSSTASIGCIVIRSSRSDSCSPWTQPWFGSGTGTTTQRCGRRCARSSRTPTSGHWLDGDEIRAFHLRFDSASLRRRDVSPRAGHRDLSQLPLVHQAQGHARV